MKKYTLLLLALLFFPSCEEKDEGEESLQIDMEQEILNDTPPAFDPVGVWEIYMDYYCAGISSTVNIREETPNGKNIRLYYQLFADNTYSRCRVEYVDSVNTEVSTERGTWQQAGDIVRLTSEDNKSVDYKVTFDTYDFSYSFDLINKVEFFFPYNKLMVYCFYGVAKRAHEMEIDAPEALPYLHFPFHRVDIMSMHYLTWNNTNWVLSPDGTLDVYTNTHRWDYNRTVNRDPETRPKTLVLHNKGTLKVLQYEECDSVDIFIEDYEVVTENVIHPQSKYAAEFSYLLPGHHRYPIEYGYKIARIGREIDNLPPIILKYGVADSRWDWIYENDGYSVVPTTFDFSSYPIYSD